MSKHQWDWVGQEERYYFGDPDKPYAVDIWHCARCGAETSSKSTSTPSDKGCKAS